MANISKTKQYRCVSSGLALGLLANGCNQIPNNKPTVEFAFISAWRKWSHRSALPSADPRIAGSIKDLDVIWIMTDLDSERKAGGLPFFWEPHAPGGITIVLRDTGDFDPTKNNDLGDCAEMIHEEIPARAWQELAHAFLEKLSKD